MNFATYLTESKYKTEITLENAIEIVKKELYERTVFRFI